MLMIVWVFEGGAAMLTPVKITPPPLSSFGGLDGLRSTLEHFYQRVFNDPMIGYLFVGQDQQRLIDRELEWTARALGVALDYQGRPLARVHQRHPIRRGHFHRRNQLLLESIEQCGLPSDVYRWWQAHSASLEVAILGSASNDTRCEQTADEENQDEEEMLMIAQGKASRSTCDESISVWGVSTHINKSSDSQGD
jgi:truncated hemoglobin YjbI